MLLKLIGVKKRIGFNYRNRGKFLTDKIEIEGFDNKHVVEYYLDTLRSLGIEKIGHAVSPKIYASKANLRRAEELLSSGGVVEGDLLIGMMPGCGASWGMDATYRRWNKRNFAALADRLIDKYNARIILLGDVKEMQLCRDVEDLMHGKVINICGKTSIGEFLGILSKCKIVMTNDGGPLHMAAALGIKTVSIFGPVDETVYGPYPPDGNHAVISRKDLPCRPCYKKFKYNKCENRLCLDSITVDDVFNASEKILKR